MGKEGRTVCDVDLDAKKLRFTRAGRIKDYALGLSQFDEALVKVGGWVESADAKY